MTMPFDRITFSSADLSFEVAAGDVRHKHRNCASLNSMRRDMCVEVLRLAGWSATGGDYAEIARLPLRRADDERWLGADGVDDRACGFSARRAVDGKLAEVIVECSRGFAPLILCKRGDATQVAEAVSYYFLRD